MKVRKIDLSWAAGLFEGEGSAFIEWNHTNGQGRSYPSPKVVVAMADEAIVKRLQRLLGGSAYISDTLGVNSHGVKRNRVIWRWSTNSRKAYTAAKLLIPYVFGEKRVKLEEIIDYYDRKDGLKHE